MRARLPKNFVLEDKLTQYANFIEIAPAHYQGVWKEAAAPAGTQPFAELWLDLGCGRGSFAVAVAQAHPKVLVVAVDLEPVSIAYTAQKAAEAGVKNVVCVPARAEALPNIFAKGEVDRIIMNFPTPFPRKKESKHRLTAPERLAEYANLLAPDAELQLRTDSQPFFDFTRDMLDGLGFSLTFIAHDAHGEKTLGPSSEYEERLTQAGCKVLALRAQAPSAVPAVLPDGVCSLVDYLPADLENVAYAPLGMEATFENLKNVQAREKRKKRRRRG